VAYSRGAQSSVDFVSFVGYAPVNPAADQGGALARKTVLVCDNCENEIEEAKGAVMRINFNDARRASKQADLCDPCASDMPGHAAARRGRRPKSAAA
jgi:hypothetical protein